MMLFASDCCKVSKLLVDLFLESYTRCTSLNGILINCVVSEIAIESFLSVTIMDNNLQLGWVYNDAICIGMLQSLQITCGFVSGGVHQVYHCQWNFKKLHCS